MDMCTHTLKNIQLPISGQYRLFPDNKDKK